MERLYSWDTSYDKNLFVRESHNCYNYFLNLKSRRAYNLCKKEHKPGHRCRRPQPGYAVQMPMIKSADLNCKSMMDRTLSDNKHMFRTKKNCPKTHYKGALVVAPGNDYHYYRLNDDGVWTHKPGHTQTRSFNADHADITDPETANRKYRNADYSDFCGYLCVPRSRKQKRMKMYKEK